MLNMRILILEDDKLGLATNSFLLRKTFIMVFVFNNYLKYSIHKRSRKEKIMLL